MIKLNLIFVLSFMCFSRANKLDINLIKKIEFHLNFIEKIYKKYKNITILFDDSLKIQNNYLENSVKTFKENNELIIDTDNINNDLLEEILDLSIKLYKNFIFKILPDLENEKIEITVMHKTNEHNYNKLDLLNEYQRKVSKALKLKNIVPDWQKVLLKYFYSVVTLIIIYKLTKSPLNK